MSPKGPQTYYLCGVDYQHELGEAADGTPMYPSAESLKKYRKCWKKCGIVEVKLEIKEVTWVEKQDFSIKNLEKTRKEDE